MDVRNLTFEDSTFDVVIDKGDAWRVFLPTYQTLRLFLRHNGRDDDNKR